MCIGKEILQQMPPLGKKNSDTKKDYGKTFNFSELVPSYLKSRWLEAGSKLVFSSGAENGTPILLSY